MHWIGNPQASSHHMVRTSNKNCETDCKDYELFCKFQETVSITILVVWQ